MREIGQLYKAAPELCWEEKWARVELQSREACPQASADDGRLDTRIERLTDPGIFTGCSTEEGRKAALIGIAGPISASSTSRPSNSYEEARAGSTPTEYDEAGIWQVLVDSCKKASAEKRKARVQRVAA